LKSSSSRRNFLAAGLALPVAGLGSVRSPETLIAQQSPKLKSSTPSFRYRQLGKTGLKVTEVGFGCMITSDPSVIERAADIGINYFDTARGYQSGNNEKMVGGALKSKRKDIVLSTKSHGANKEAALNDLNTSLRELGTDYVDVWYLHARNKGSEITDDLIEAQQIAKKEGKIRFAGVSTHSGQADVIQTALKTGKIDVVLLGYNFARDLALDPVVEAARKAGVGMVAMKVMAGGFRRAKPGEKTAEILKREGAMLSALKWVLKNPNIDTTIPSMTDMDQLDENLKAMSAPFSATDEKVLAAQLEHISPMYCRMCQECTGTCAKGLPVQDMLRVLTYADGYGQFALARERFLELPQEHTQVRCNECPTCSFTCPLGVKVAERLTRAQELFV
jgi:uncharacterized protein